MATPIAAVSFTNDLDFAVHVYDSFGNSLDTDYFGTLTLVASIIPAHTTMKITPIHQSSVLIVENATDSTPVARLIISPFNNKPLSVGIADLKAMSQTMEFIRFILQNPNDPLTTAWLHAWDDPSAILTSIDLFFSQHPAYSSCTLETYMMGITYAAKHPINIDTTKTWSLKELVESKGRKWPEGLPDITLTSLTFENKDNSIDIEGEIDLDKLPAQSDQALHFFGSLFDVHLLDFSINFDYQFGLDLFGTRLSMNLDRLHIPFGKAHLIVNEPTITIDINPLFKFVVFSVFGTIPFNIFGKTFEADVSMVIDNDEASFGVVIRGDNTSLPAPPIMKGVHFDEFGVGIGVFFEPPGAAIGISGKFHIGDPGTSPIALADSEFTVVCQQVADVPVPLYISFYIPQMHLTDVLTLFTNSKSAIDVPVSFSDLSFKWLRDPMQPVTLPDGSLCDMAYGFSAAAGIFAFKFYGDIEINLDDGLTADIEMSPLTIGPIFSMGGNGTGFSMKVDANGNPIKNNQLITKAEEQKVLATAKMVQIVPPGGPILKIQTFSSPFLHLNGYVSLFEISKASLNVDITKNGIIFDLSYGTILTTTMHITLLDYHNLSASFQYGIDEAIRLPSIAGQNLGSIHLQSIASIHFALSTSSTNVILSVGGNFNFEGMQRSFGDFKADINIRRVRDLLTAIGNYIQQEAQHIFGDILSTGAAWAGKVKTGIVTGADQVASVLHNAYNQSADQVASTMRSVGYDANEVARQLKSIFDPTAVASALKNAYGMSAQAIGSAMQKVGYTAEDTAKALGNTFSNDAGQVADAMKSVYGWSSDTAKKAGQTIEDGAKKAGSTIEDGAKKAGDALDPRHWF